MRPRAPAQREAGRRSGQGLAPLSLNTCFHGPHEAAGPGTGGPGPRVGAVLGSGDGTTRRYPQHMGGRDPKPKKGSGNTLGKAGGGRGPGGSDNWRSSDTEPRGRWRERFHPRDLGRRKGHTPQSQGLGLRVTRHALHTFLPNGRSCLGLISSSERGLSSS